jgi:hypothetical protein
MEEPLVIGKPSGPRHAIFGCKDGSDRTDVLSHLAGSDEPPEGLSNGCVPFVDYLPPLYEDLPVCPHCGGPSMLFELLEPVAG